MEMERLYKDIVDNLEDGIYFVDQERRFTLWNKAAERITGYTAGEILGRQCQDNILDHIDMEGRPLCLLGCPLFATLGDGERRVDEVLLRHKDGHRIAMLVKILPVFDDDGSVLGAFEIFTPRTNLASDSQLIDSLTDRVMTDALTGLPNRTYLETFLEHKMEEYKRFGTWYAVVFMDIDNFRNFNNNYGHHVGDRVLKAIANSLSGNLRSTDAIGRWGGEEFIGIFAIRNNQEACVVGEKVRLLVENSEVMDGRERLNVTASIGVAVGSLEDTADRVVERADRFMYLSKNAGKNCVHVEDARHPERVMTAAQISVAE